VHFDIGKGSLLEWLLAALFAVMTFALFIGTFFVFFGVIFGNLRDRWPSYEPKKRRKIIVRLAVWGSVFVACGFVSMIKLTPVTA
jgi:vacuolar-type H+-ATPase subunit I/STV1